MHETNVAALFGKGLEHGVYCARVFTVMRFYCVKSRCYRNSWP